jgi:putative acetyltransferase
VVTRWKSPLSNLCRVLIEVRDASDPVVLQLSGEHQAEVTLAHGGGRLSNPPHDGIEFVVGFVDGRPVACGALQPLSLGVGELKRMYVRPPFRGQGLSRLILAALEERALQLGFHTLRLETGQNLAPALGLYQGADYQPIPLYGEDIGSSTSLCFEKSLLTVEV